MNKQGGIGAKKQGDRLVELVEFLMKIEKREEEGLNAEMIVLDIDGNEVKL